MNKCIKTILLSLLRYLSMLFFVTYTATYFQQHETYAQHSAASTYIIKIDNKALSFKDHDFTIAAQRIIDNAENISDTQNRKPSIVEIKRLADSYGLLNESELNPHLSFLDGDISYWYEQGLSLRRLNLEFSARKIVLDVADREGMIISDQGKLSWAVQSIMAKILKRRRDMEESYTNK